jgi:hypothetical protein
MFTSELNHYTDSELKQRVRRATASIRAGKGYTAAEMKSLHKQTYNVKPIT